MTLRPLHRRLCALLALTAVIAFVSGAGLDAPSIVPATVLLLLGMAWDPPERLRVRAELAWRALALLLALRAGYHALFVPEDVVLPMVDLLLLLVLAETYRAQDATGEARLYALTFALLIASAAYRPGFLFGIAFVAYVAILTVTMIVGQLARRVHDRHAREPRLPRYFLAQSAAISLVVLAVSAFVFLAFPRVARGWAARAATPVGNVIGFSDRVSLLDHGSRLYPNPEVVLRVEFPGGDRPSPDRLYWRGRSYDRFDGWSWSRSPFLPTALVEAARWPAGRIEQVVFQSPLLDANVLFGLSPVLRVDARSRIAPYRENNGDYAYAGRDEPVFRALSLAEPPSPDSLRAAAGEASRVLGSYLRLPPLSGRMLALADSLARGRGTDYDRAVAVRDYLRSGFGYTLDLPQSAHEASLDHFLFVRREGHCEYFSTAMAVLLRAMGVPARNVNGFLGGEWNEFGRYLTVTQNQAHSWVEVWFPRYGWVLFDPTPAATAAQAAGARAWLSPLRSILDGLEHRWGKWVLDFDLETQVGLARRAADATGTTARGAEPGGYRSRRLLLAALAVAALALALGRLRFQARRSASPTSATRAYLRLRRTYARRGLADAQAPPLAFLGALRSAAAPGLEDAEAAVALYTRARFAGRPLDPVQRDALREHVRRARAAVRRAGATRLRVDRA